jgi:hypothetical protein
MFDVGSAEIGRSLLIYVSLSGVQVGIGSPERSGLRIYNLIEGPWTDLLDKHRFDGSAAEPPTDEEMDRAHALQGRYVIWQYAPQRVVHRVWWINVLEKGDLLVLPVGSPANAAVPARGIAAYTDSAENILATRFPGVQTRLIEKATLPVPFTSDYLGWELFEVGDITGSSGDFAGLQQLAAGKGWSAIGWTPSREPYRWGYNGAQIPTGQSSTGAAILDLEPNGQLGLPLALRAVDGSGREIAQWPLTGRQKVRLPLEGPEQSIRLVVPDALGAAPDRICFRIFSVSSTP